MATLHPTLVRQLGRIGGTDSSTPPTKEAWSQFLERVSQSYIKADQDRYLLERSLGMSSQEMQNEIAERKRAEEALQKAREILAQQNQRLERVNELFRSITEQLTQAISHGATAKELQSDLTLLQMQFERLDGRGSKSNGPGGQTNEAG